MSIASAWAALFLGGAASAQQAAPAQGAAASSVPPSPAPGSLPALPAGSVGGMGDINLFPKRIVIDGRQRIATVGLYNKVATTGEYEIAVTDKAMTPDGRLIDLAEADAALRARVKTASQMLRWSPRKLSLQGNESQTVRIMARTPPDLPPGEYRSHFMAIAVPPAEALGNSIDDAVASGKPDRAIGVRIIPRFGISIPVIVRVGQTTLAVGLRDLQIVAMPEGGRGVAFTITRSGTRSAFGDILVTAPGLKKPVAEINGVGVYTEVDSRKVVVAINPAIDPRSVASGTKLTVSYRDDDAEPGQMLARQEFTVP